MLALLLCFLIGHSYAFTAPPGRNPEKFYSYLNERNDLKVNGMKQRDDQGPRRNDAIGGPISNVDRRWRRGGGIELGIQTAQLLMDTRQHKRLKDQISATFPWMPGNALDVAINLVAKAFTNIAPDDLKSALKPGGMERARPAIRQSIVSFVLEHQTIKDFKLLNDNEKHRLMESLVDMAMNELLKDAEWVLSAPEVRLEALEMEVKTVKDEMGICVSSNFAINNTHVNTFLLQFPPLWHFILDTWGLFLKQRHQFAMD